MIKRSMVDCPSPANIANSSSRTGVKPNVRYVEHGTVEEKDSKGLIVLSGGGG
jgi:hypothetical protein